MIFFSNSNPDLIYTSVLDFYPECRYNSCLTSPLFFLKEVHIHSPRDISTGLIILEWSVTAKPTSVIKSAADGRTLAVVPGLLPARLAAPAAHWFNWGRGTPAAATAVLGATSTPLAATAASSVTRIGVPTIFFGLHRA
jgi:hypothetical protein